MRSLFKAVGCALIALNVFATHVDAAKKKKEPPPPCEETTRYGAIDLSEPLNNDSLSKLDKLESKIILRYFDEPDETIPKKTICLKEADAILLSKRSIGVVFQHNNDDPKTFLVDPEGRGRRDAIRSLELAKGHGQPFGSAIYFGIDGVERHMMDLVKLYLKYNGANLTPEQIKSIDNTKLTDQHAEFSDYQKDVFNRPLKDVTEEYMLSYVGRYFEAVKKIFDEASGSDPAKGYAIGGYGSGYTLQYLHDNKPFVKYRWLAAATSWTDFDKFKKTDLWHMTQKPTCVWKGIELDFNELNARNKDYPHVGEWSTHDQRKPIATWPKLCPQNGAASQ